MRKQSRLSESVRAVAIIRPREPTMRHLAVLDAYADAGNYVLAAATTGISPALVRNLLIEIRQHYGAATTIQAYRAALAAGDLTTPPGTVSPPARDLPVQGLGDRNRGLG